MAKFDVKEVVTNSIIKAIEAGTPPWRKPWTGECMSSAHMRLMQPPLE